MASVETCQHHQPVVSQRQRRNVPAVSPMEAFHNIDIFCPSEFMFEKHRIVMNAELFPQSELSKEDLERMSEVVDQDYHYETAPALVKSLRLLEQFTTNPSHVIFVVTMDVCSVTEELRTYFHPRKLVGNLNEHMWMYRTLDVVVATAADAEEVVVNCPFHWKIVDGFVVDGRSSSPEFMQQVRAMLRTFQDFPGAAFLLPTDLKTDKTFRSRFLTQITKDKVLDKFRPRISCDLLEAIKLYLPEAASCLGFLDSSFHKASDNFSVNNINRMLVARDYSIFVAFMPGLVRAAMDISVTGSVVITSEDRVSALTELLGTFVVHLGLFEIRVDALNEEQPTRKVNIAVGTPEKVLEFLKSEEHRPAEVKRLVIYETDRLCTSGFQEEIVSVLGMTSSGARVGLHSLNLTPAVEDVVRSGPADVGRLDKAEFTLESVYHLFEVVEDKVRKVVEIWKQWAMLAKVAVMCSSVEEVERVASQLQDADVWIVKAHTGMDVDILDDAGAEFSRRRSLLVTNINYEFGRQHIINLDVRDPQGYVKRAGVSRGGSYKIIINLFTEEEVSQKEHVEEVFGITMQPLPRNCRKLPDQMYCWEHGLPFEG